MLMLNFNLIKIGVIKNDKRQYEKKGLGYKKTTRQWKKSNR